MSEANAPSKFWSVVGIGIPALTTVAAVAAALMTAQRTLYVCVAVFAAGTTLLAVQRVYAVFSRPK